MEMLIYRAEISRIALENRGEPLGETYWTLSKNGHAHAFICREIHPGSMVVKKYQII